MQIDDILLTVYIGQEVNYSRGVLYEFRRKSQFSENENKIIDSLIEKELVKRTQPYSVKSLITLVTTRAGKDKSRTLIQEMLLRDSTLLDELNGIPKKALGFLLVNLDYGIFEKSRSKWFRDWKDFILHVTNMFDYSIRFCQILKQHGLAVLTHDYVSSHGGRIDPEKYVIPEEVREYLTKNVNLDPFNNKEINRSILFYILYKIKNDILPIKDDGRRRNNYWNLLRALPFDESTIKSLIDEFHKKNITTAYSKIEDEQFLFSVLDQSRFDVTLNGLVEDFVSGIVKGRVVKPSVPVAKAPQFLQVHSDLFSLIGSFEIKFREYLINEMRAVFKEDKNEWYG